MTNSTKWTVVIALALLLLGIAIGIFAFRPAPEVIYKPVIERYSDTIRQVIEVPKDVIRIRTVAQVIYKDGPTAYVHDTVYKTRPFVACLDTIVKRDTINITYSFPQHIFDLEYHPSPDSVVYDRIETVIRVPRDKVWHEEPWFRVTTHVLTAALTAWVCKK